MYQSFIGLEIHVHLLTKSKVFCGCKAHFGDEPNTNVCPVCMGLPGVLPRLNTDSIKMGYQVARALNCQLADECVFERKNYFYPDMPKNYQISQFAQPLGTNGFIEIDIDGQRKKVRIHECHLEEDAGKMIHAGDMSLLDYNRAGYSLLEIVTEPDLTRPEEAEILLHEMRRLVRYLGVSDGNMEEGSLRCDGNISINKPGAGLGKKVEVKNLNSSRFVRKALAYEYDRQSALFDTGKPIIQETRLWNENRDQTESMRTKESAHDYRFFPEPDLPPFVASGAFLASLELMPELPLAKRDRFKAKYRLNDAQVDFICEELNTAEWFEHVVSEGTSPDQVATWLAGDVQKLLNRTNLTLAESPLANPHDFAQLLKAIDAGRINGKIAKQVLDLVFEEKKDPETIIRTHGLEQVSDTKAIEAAVDKVLAEQAKAVADYRGGDQKAIGFLIGQVMRQTGGKAQPQTVTDLLKAKLM